MVKPRVCVSCGNLTDTGEHICSRCRMRHDEETHAKAPERAKRILLIDDEEGILTLFKNRLEANHYEVVTAADGVQGFAQLAKERPDLVILDILMPGMSGYDFVKKVKRESNGLEQIPLIVITAQERMKQFFHPWDVEAFMTKPIDPPELIATIRRILKQDS
mgnify:FL=1